MTDPLEEWHRAAIAETMRPCPEYHGDPNPPKRRAPVLRLMCPACGVTPASLEKHIRTRHPGAVVTNPQPVDTAVENEHGVAS